VAPWNTRSVPASVLAVAALAWSAPAWAIVPKQPGAPLADRAFFKPELYISSASVPLADLKDRIGNRAAWDAFLAQPEGYASDVHVFLDPRSGSAVSIIGAYPIIPGSGFGNQVTLQTLGGRLGRVVRAVDSAVVADAVLLFARTHQDVLGLDVAQLGTPRAEQVTPELWQVSIPQQVGGVPVRYGRLLASISHGNLVLIGTETWGDAALDVTPRVGAGDALDAGFAYVEGWQAGDVLLQDPALEVLPVAPPAYQTGEAFTGPVGSGYEHRLVWTFRFQRPPDLAQWEVTVDAHTAEVLALEDKNQYVERQVNGGVYPLTDTGICTNVDQCGTMQSGWPMPFANTGLAAPNNFTNSAGVFQWSSGNVTTTLNGQFFRMSDNCGALSATAAGDVPLGGSNNQHDCTTPGFGGAGNTPASRAGFYELNKLGEQARGWLPTNAWLQGQVTANMNINLTCNAFWNGSTVNFYRSGGGCRNTGEIAAVFDHEWGHGLDDNDAAGVLSNSSEGYADIAAIYRLEASCVGFGFFQSVDDGCGMTADGTGFNTNEALTGAAYCATDCSGVRDTDYAKHSPATPATPLGFVCGQCTTGTGPCGRQVHCSAAPVRQAAWDFVNRDLTAAPFSYDSQTAYLVGNRVFYQGSGNIGAWHSCTCGSSATGCASANGYMQWITVDDDNGNINDGTPHMTAIFNAFNRHGIACSTPTAVNSGCAGGPSGAPTLTVTPGNYSNQLAWTTVAGATRYWVFRTEGHAGCNLGKVKLAEVTGTSYTDTKVANGRTYYYTVVAAGASNSCYGRASNCANGTPTSSPDFTLSCSPASLTVQQGNNGTSTCTVTSTGGFSSPVTLSCAGLPSGVSCAYNPGSVTPPANGSVNSTLTVSVGGSVPAGGYSFQAQGTDGTVTRTFGMSLTVTSAPVPDFGISASPSSVSVAQGGTATSTVTVSSLNGFSSAVTLTASGLPGGVTASFSANPITPPAGGSAGSILTFTASAGAATGTFTVTATGTSGSLVHSTNISLTVTGTGGGGDQLAVFDAALQAPKCGTVGRSCDSGAALVLGRASLGPEPNQPNTINDSCADGASGVFHSDESNDRIKVSTVDGTDFGPGKTVRIDATVWAWTTPSSDKLDLFYAANASSPSWTLITTLTPTVAGSQVLSATYTLPAGALQAVRAQFRYQSTAAACSAGGFNDRDDLVFAVTSTPSTTVFEDNFETATGWVTNPGGTDTATTGMWERGDPEATSDLGAKQLGTTTSGVNDLVTGRLAGASAGAFDIDSGVTTIQSPLIALPSTGVLTLSFQYYLAHGSNATSADYFRVRVVGSTTTTVLNVPGAAVNRNGVWTAFSGNISGHAGQTVRIVVDAADASTASLVEAGVDDVKITQQ
jgi:trimeric autotransporter adhesin